MLLDKDISDKVFTLLKPLFKKDALERSRDPYYFLDMLIKGVKMPKIDLPNIITEKELNVILKPIVSQLEDLEQENSELKILLKQLKEAVEETE